MLAKEHIFAHTLLFLLACMNLYQDEAPTANELAKTMGCSRQNVKEILNSLEVSAYLLGAYDIKYIEPILECLKGRI